MGNVLAELTKVIFPNDFLLHELLSLIELVDFQVGFCEQKGLSEVKAFY